ncbi:protein STRUBBELIG-RECEPTOR FAMILY 1 [Sesamum angolense]|uniref:Protein STRUBBELIG-RECEPTOR FAMILY 1 n=1 Tax=Sesamum angolense TaxID=2727404 RepID=A0AAE2BVE4_9LAMI|nr:protein STRUBBELIG-RECEPTOR FAMILY 1 [Sesamum angolense]
MMACSDWSHTWVLGVFLILAAVPLVWGFTDPRDVYAITQLHASLGFPLLPGWIPGGDPCGPPSWQGVECVNANITAIKLNGANLGGELSEDLGSFASIILIDLSNNHIGGSIPTDLPTTLRSLSLNNNQLTGPIPDAFEPLKDLINMDLSGNSLTSQLPSSMGNLSSLTTLRAGNPFNTTILPSPPASPPILPPSRAPSPQSVPGAQVYKPSAPLPESGRDEKKHSTNKITWIAVGGLLVVLVLLVVLCLSMSRCCRGRRLSEKTSKSHEMGTYGVLPETHRRDQTLRNPLYQVEKGPQAASKKMDLQPAIGGSRSNNAFQKQGKDHRIDMMGSRDTDLPPGHLPFPLLPAERIVADPTFTPLTARENASKIVESSKYFTIASLQQYTNSFSQENLIGRGVLGTVYRAQLPDGKVLAVKKLDKAASAHLSDREFLGLVASISKLRHENIVELVGYCLEHGQRLLVYSYCRNGTLDEALNLDDEINKKLSWNVRMRLALQAAKALEYLHEVCQPPVMHRNFKSCNVLLEDDLTVRVSDCGLASLLSTNSMAKLQESGYGAPELELGSYSCQSDVYSFGVVMLQLLTGRKSYDRFRPRGEQHLVRWALSRLHDIDTLSRMVDPSLNGAYPSKSLSRVADIISLCIQPEPEFRPPMSEIVQKLLHMIQRDS